MNKNSKWMIISGLTGFSFFLIANFTTIFVGLNMLTGLIQICINAFVFVVWQKAFAQSLGFKKIVALIGTIVPVVMMSITTWRVLIPALSN